MAEKNRYTTLEDDDIGMLTISVIHGWPSTRADVKKEVQPYWSFQDQVTVIDGIAMKGR